VKSFPSATGALFDYYPIGKFGKCKFYEQSPAKPVVVRKTRHFPTQKTLLKIKEVVFWRQKVLGLFARLPNGIIPQSICIAGRSHLPAPSRRRVAPKEGTIYH